MNSERKIYIAGHNGMVGSSLIRILKSKGYRNLITINKEKLNLCDQQNVKDFFNEEKPEVVINAAAKVGGIYANKENPYKFIMDNMQIQNNIIDCSVRFKVSKFIFLGSSCIYPKLAKQPIKEEYLLSSSLEPSNESYAIAKIAGLKACEAARKQLNRNFICLMPSNLYGPNDNFDLMNSHVLPAMLRKFFEGKNRGSKTVTLWGTGKPFREFLYVDDLAECISFILTKNLPDVTYNVGTGLEISIKSLAEIIKQAVGYNGDVCWDSSKPDGTPRKLLDITKIENVGWKWKTELKKGIELTYDWFLKNETIKLTIN
jgi:GDP-L-fucose synthase